MDLEQYCWRDHVIRSGWWVAELGVTLFALTALLAASLIEPTDSDFRHIQTAPTGVAAMPECHFCQTHLGKGGAGSTMTMKPVIRPAQPHPTASAMASGS